MVRKINPFILALLGTVLFLYSCNKETTSIYLDQNKAMLDTEKHYIMLQNYVQGMKAFLQETFVLNDQEALSMIFVGIADLAPIPDGLNHD
jgi:hypothetical protein